MQEGVMTVPGQPAPISRGPLAITTALTGVVGVGVIAQGLIAGLFLDGSGHQRAIDAHEMLGPLLVLVALAAAMVSSLQLRGSASGQKVSHATLGLAAALTIEVVLGFISSDHPALLAVHIPVAIGMFGFFIRTSSALRSLRSPARGDEGGRS
jgi:hypothetical protein